MWKLRVSATYIPSNSLIKFNILRIVYDLTFCLSHTVFTILALKLHPSSEDERVQEWYHMCILPTYSPVPVMEAQKIITNLL
jgi:hypothetical protein